MSPRNPQLGLLAAGLVLLAGFAPVLASEGPSPELPARVQKTALAGPEPSIPDGLDRHQIFEILQGGVAIDDVDLADHLWRVAGSLAARGWKPPQVKVSVVVREPAAR